MQQRDEEEASAPLVAWFATPRGFVVSAAVLVVVAVVLLFGNLSRIGIWEPWEASEIQVAQQYVNRADFVANPEDLSKPGYNWAVPTYDGQPVARPLLKTWLMGASLMIAGVDDAPKIGALEFSARFPLAFAALLMVLLGYLWMRRYFGGWTALMTGLATASLPAVYLGAQLATSEMLFMVTTSLAIMAFAQLVFADSKKLLWGALFGLALALAFLDQRLLGLYLPLGIVAAFALSQLPYLEAMRLRGDPGAPKHVGALEIGLGTGALLAAVATLIWGLVRSSDAPDSVVFLPHVGQWVAALVPIFVIAAGLLFARQTSVVKSLVSLPGAVAGAIVAVPLIAVSIAYGDANPVLLQDGEVIGKIPVFTYLLENHLFSSSLASDHIHFAMWLRQVGFAMLPWVALVPLALGYLARSTRLEDEDGEPITDLLSPQLAIQRLLLVWIFAAFVIVAIAASQNHYYYPAYFPLMAGVGLLMTDAKFWKSVRLRPFLLGAMGFTAVATIMMLGKDLERYPTRLIELFVHLQRDFTLPETYSYGSTLKALKYASMLLLMAYFGGLVSWFMLTLRDVKGLPSAAKSWWKSRRAPSEAALTPGVDGTTEHPSPAARRAQAREAYRDEGGLLSKLASLVEKPQGYSVLLAASFVVFATVVAFDFAPKLSHHLSQRGVYQTYLDRAQSGEELFRYQVPATQKSVYLDNTATISASADFLTRFAAEPRFFAVIARDKLAPVNTEVRAAHKRNLTVLDARSSRLLLVSNQIKAGEEDQNFVAAAIVEDDSEVQRHVRFGDEGAQSYATFDKQLEFLGYSLNKPMDADGIGTYRWGETMVLTTYYRVLRKVPGSQKIFMHIDFPGNRINGDHDPVNGEFPTNHWLPGDIVKDEFSVAIERYSSVGVYSMNFGFFRGANRMSVEPRSAHDGQNRIMMGRIRVEAF
ncbi:MAG: glycosyltransferase family 39 protein [Bradymonadaceae bacterium]|nr:glycosyltransferase family 39 protein [Lujinxingiaceae bacterium]